MCVIHQQDSQSFWDILTNAKLKATSKIKKINSTQYLLTFHFYSWFTACVLNTVKALETKL